MSKPIVKHSSDNHGTDIKLSWKVQFFIIVLIVDCTFTFKNKYLELIYIKYNIHWNTKTKMILIECSTLNIIKYMFAYHLRSDF